jgi:hypothetical protein
MSALAGTASHEVPLGNRGADDRTTDRVAATVEAVDVSDRMRKLAETVLNKRRTAA